MKIEQGKASVGANRNVDVSEKVWDEIYRETMKISPPLRQEDFNTFRNNMSKVVKQYEPIITHHIDTYRKEFTLFFEKHSQSFIGFDIEEWPIIKKSNEIFCIAGLKIHPDLTFEIKIISTNNKPSIIQSKKSIENFSKWLDKNKHKNLDIVTHGTNTNESTLSNKPYLTHKNSQKYMSRAKKEKVDLELQGFSLAHFESKQDINFQRMACSYFKHKGIKGLKKMKLFVARSKICILDHLENKDQMICRSCNKPQDIFLYCLEDAFSSMLAYVYYFNRGVFMK